MRVPVVPAAFMVLLLLVSLHTPPAAAAEPLAKIENTGTALVFHPAQETAGLTLTISGPCGYRYETTVKEGPVKFGLQEETLDGPYTYSLVAAPVIDPGVRKVLLAARESGDRRAIHELCRDGKLPVLPAPQSEGFTVVERQIVYEAYPEAQRRTDRDEEAKASLAPAAPSPLSGEPASEVAVAALPPAPRATASQCAWARMLPGAGVAER